MNQEAQTKQIGPVPQVKPGRGRYLPDGSFSMTLTKSQLFALWYYKDGPPILWPEFHVTLSCGMKSFTGLGVNDFHNGNLLDLVNLRVTRKGVEIFKKRMGEWRIELHTVTMERLEVLDTSTPILVNGRYAEWGNGDHPPDWRCFIEFVRETPYWSTQILKEWGMLVIQSGQSLQLVLDPNIPQSDLANIIDRSSRVGTKPLPMAMLDWHRTSLGFVSLASQIQATEFSFAVLKGYRRKLFLHEADCNSYLVECLNAQEYEVIHTGKAFVPNPVNQLGEGR